MAKKKIIFVMNNFWVGGVERLLSDLTKTLSATHDVQVVTVLGSGLMESEFCVPVHHTSPVVFADKKLYFKFFWLMAAPVTFIRLVIFFNKVKPDIVITSIYQADVLGVLGAYICGVKKRVVIQHDVQKFGFFRKKFKFLFSLNLATDIIAVSNTVGDFLASYWHIPPSKI